MNTVNHRLLKRADLKKILADDKIATCLIPDDGEMITLVPRE
jgi:hypothetical protein